MNSLDQEQQVCVVAITIGLCTPDKNSFLLGHLNASLRNYLDSVKISGLVWVLSSHLRKKNSVAM